MKPALPLFILLAAGGGAYYYFNRPPTELVLTGIVTTREVLVAPQVGGRIEQLLVADGQAVTRGQLIAVLAPDELRAERAYAVHNAESVGSQIEEARASMRYEELQTTEQVRQAESGLAATEAQQAAAAADLESLRLTFTRTERLSREGVAAAQQLDEARSKYQAAQARVEALRKEADAQRAAIMLARSNAEQVAVRRSQMQTHQHMQAAATAQQTVADVRLAYTEVTAPIDGLVDVRAALQGEVVTPGQPIVTLVNPDDLWVRADVEESYLDRVRLNDRMKVRLPSGAEIEGVVFYRGVDAGFATQRDVSRTKRDIRTFEIRVRCDNADRRLAVGMTAYVLLPLR
jgi:HlyD family secretion protein